MRTVRGSLPWVVAAVLSDVSIASAWGAHAGGGVPLVSALEQTVLMISFLAAGALLVSRRPDHPVSWILPLPALYLALDASLDMVATVVPVSEVWLDWFSQTSFSYTLPVTGIFLPLLFPTGRLPSPRWRWLAWLGGLAVVLVTIGNAVDPGLVEPATNPVAADADVAGVITTVGGLLLGVSFLSAMVSAVVRYRRSTGVERQQLRWFVRAAAAFPLAWIFAVVTEHGPHQQLGGFAAGLAASLLPVAVAVAVLRYRLYDIDRVVSRVVAYAVVTAVLAGVYAGGVLGVGAVLPGKDSDLLVAGSTLAVAGAFHPLRRRVQAVVDRRFARSQHDAASAVAGFVGRLRDEVHLEAIEGDLGEVVRDLWSPAHASVWLRGRGLEAGT